MEVENVATKGVANTALGLGIAGLSVGILEKMMKEIENQK